MRGRWQEIYERARVEREGDDGMDPTGIDGRHLVRLLIRDVLPKLSRRFIPSLPVMTRAQVRSVNPKY